MSITAHQSSLTFPKQGCNFPPFSSGSWPSPLTLQIVLTTLFRGNLGALRKKFPQSLAFSKPQKHVFLNLLNSNFRSDAFSLVHGQSFQIFFTSCFSSYLLSLLYCQPLCFYQLLPWRTYKHVPISHPKYTHTHHLLSILLFIDKTLDMIVYTHFINTFTNYIIGPLHFSFCKHWSIYIHYPGFP